MTVGVGCFLLILFQVIHYTYTRLYIIHIPGYTLYIYQVIHYTYTRLYIIHIPGYTLYIFQVISLGETKNISHKLLIYLQKDCIKPNYYKVAPNYLHFLVKLSLKIFSELINELILAVFPHC